MGEVGSARARTPRRGRRWAVGGVLVAVPAVLAGVVAIGGGGAATYRTASVETADVDATLDTPGTIQPINQANLSFPVSGIVRDVSATVGQHVSVGQTLAQLDMTSLDAQLASAQAALAASQARLATDQSSQTLTAAVAPTAFSAEITTSSPEPITEGRDQVSQQQARVLADQHQADQDISQEKRDLTTEKDLCRALLDPDQTPVPTSPRSKSLVSTSHQVTAPAAPEMSTCQAAITTVLADQAAVDRDQQAVAADLPALSAAIGKVMTTARAIDQPPPSPAPEPTHTPKPAPTPKPTPKPTQPPRTPTTSVPGNTSRTAAVLRPASAEQLASDQAAIDAAQAQLTEAQQAHDQAQLRSPIDGTIGSVTISAGQSVPGSSATPQIVVIGPGAHQVTTSVSDIDVGSVRVGAAATVTPSGGNAPLHGQVIAIGPLGSASTAGSISYPVTIGLPGTDGQLFAGESASVSILLGHASGTLTVPTSAVRRQGANTAVSVLREGKPSTVFVTLGAAGPTRTQVITGLHTGDQVILADLSRSLPTTGVQNIRRIAGGGGGPGG